MLSNPEAAEIIRNHVKVARKMLQQTRKGDGNIDKERAALHHAEVQCNIALSMIDKYIVLDDPRQVEKFFIYTERVRANLNHIRMDIDEDRPDQQSHIEGLNANLNDLLEILS